MGLKVTATKLPGVMIIEPDVFGDERGFFMETWRQPRYEAAGIREKFVQDNLSFSRRGVLRGLHYQYPHSQGKLVSVVSGEVYDVAVDIRVGSPTFGQWTGVLLSGENHRQFWLPAGLAHGFCVVSDTAYFTYKCTEVYTPAAEGGIRWDDPDIGVAWPLTPDNLSAKDQQYLPLCRVPADRLPKFK